MPIFQNIRAVLLTLIVCLVMSGCSTPAPTPTTVPPTEVRFQMSWIHEYSAAGYYMSEKNGHFADQNLKVDLMVGGYSDGHYISAEEEVVNGKADFGLSNAAGILQARANGSPLVAIGTVLQRNPLSVISLKSTGIQQPQDLVGKTVAASEGGATQLLNALLTSQGIDPASVNIVPRTDFGVGVLLDGSVDALVGWIINEGVAVKEAGQEPAFLLLNDYGIPDYATLLFTSEDMIKNKPDLVERFLRGVIAGWEDVVKDPEAATTETLKYNDQLKYDEQLNRLQASIPLLQPSRAKISYMDKATWENTYQVLRSAGVITQDVDVSSTFTTSFLDRIYAQ
jgi:NitT/TauT family transport system substrate-binding protein